MVILAVVLVLTLSFVAALAIGGALDHARRRLEAADVTEASEVSVAETSISPGGPDLRVGAVDDPKSLLRR